jgi:hypothetical protein
VQRELEVPVDQDADGLGRVARLGDAKPADFEELLADRHEHLRQHGVLRREVPVERRAADPASGADLADRDAVEPARREQLGRGGEQLLASGHVAQVSEH